MKPIIIHDEAKEEFDKAIAYYERQKVGLGLSLLSEVEKALLNIQLNSNAGTLYKIEEVRRYIIQRFPYLIFYAEFETFIWVIAIAHGKRKPDYWKKRQLE